VSNEPDNEWALLDVGTPCLLYPSASFIVSSQSDTALNTFWKGIGHKIRAGGDSSVSVGSHSAGRQYPCSPERTVGANIRTTVDVSPAFFLYVQLHEVMSAAITTAFIVLSGLAVTLTIVAAVLQRNSMS